MLGASYTLGFAATPKYGSSYGSSPYRTSYGNYGYSDGSSPYYSGYPAAGY